MHLPVDEEAQQAVGDSNAVPATGLSREPTMLPITKSLRFNIPPPAAETEGATPRVPVAPPPPRMPVEVFEFSQLYFLKYWYTFRHPFKCSKQNSCMRVDVEFGMGHMDE